MNLQPHSYTNDQMEDMALELEERGLYYVALDNVGQQKGSFLRKLLIDALRSKARSTGPDDAVSVPRSLAERTEAMFRSVDPHGVIAQEWKTALDATSQPTTKEKS